MELRSTLCHAVTRYDRRRVNRADYNIYALPQYLARVTDIVDDVKNGADIQSAIVAGFTPGPLRNACLKAIGGNISDAESSGTHRGMPVYRPVSKRT
jgi:hypothetical protein